MYSANRVMHRNQSCGQPEYLNIKYEGLIDINKDSILLYCV